MLKLEPDLLIQEPKSHPRVAFSFWLFLDESNRVGGLGGKAALVLEGFKDRVSH